MRRVLPLLAAAIAASACTDPVRPPTPQVRGQLTAQDVFARYVALGTSNSMGVASAGWTAASQRSAWTAQLAARVGAPFSLPLVGDPGCGPPLLPPLAADLALVGAFGNDLVAAVMTTCAPLQAGVTLPTNSVAISGANVHDARFRTLESAAAFSARIGTLYSRVLPPGKTQVTAMLEQRPTFVSVELAANDVLPASTGRVSAMTPYAEWEADYDAVLQAVRSTGARAVLVGVPNSAANFPSIRKAREFFNEWPDLLAFGITVSLNCYLSTNYVFVPGYVLTLVQNAPTTATCKDVPGAADYVLTASDVTTINARMGQMNAHMQAKAAEYGYAYFSLSALYDLPKIPFDLAGVLFSSAPFGPNISLDGVHPSAAGQRILATAAVQAINAKYGLAIP